MTPINKEKMREDMARMRAFASRHGISRKHSSHNKRKSIFKTLGMILVGGLFCFFGIIVAWASLVSIPSIDNFEYRAVAQSTKIYDRTGSIVLYDVHGNVRRTVVKLDQISPFLRNAVVAIEDADFYSHSGFRPLAFLRAAWVNITTGAYTEGGSTITQQVVKNTLLTSDKTVTRKIKEIILALRLERTYSKDQILGSYLNEICYGGTIYGAQEASQYFFGIDAKDLSLAQSAYLASLPQAPTHLSPYGQYKDELEERKNLVLAKMLEHKLISADEYDKAKTEKVNFLRQYDTGIKAPHFVFYIKNYLEQKYGADTVENGGLRVTTTLDYELQKSAEEITKRYSLQNEKIFNASNAAIVATDSKTGQILSMVGSRDYFDSKIDGKVNVAISKRQPGSSFKPFVYASALKKGYTPDTVVFDLQTQFSTACSPQDVANNTPPCYSPSNYDGIFSGPMTFRNALAQSKNIPAIKVLYLAGIKDTIKTAKDLGITTLGKADQYGLTLVLGGGEVTLLEMTGAYSVFANDGIRNPVTGILKVEDFSGNILEDFTDTHTVVLDPQIARQINDILSDNEARTPEFGANSPLYFPNYSIAAKTGTTNDFRDVWIIGYNPSITIGAWAGNNDNSPMEKKIAAFIIAPMWHEFFLNALSKYSSGSDNFIPPTPETNANIPPVLRGSWNTNPSLGIHEILFWIPKNDPRSGGYGSINDSQFQYWEFPVQLWLANNQQATIQQVETVQSPIISKSLPTNSHAISASASDFAITSPTAGSYIKIGYPFTINVFANPDAEITAVRYYLNNQLITTQTNPPFSANISIGKYGSSVLRAVAQAVDGALESSMTLEVR